MKKTRAGLVGTLLLTLGGWVSAYAQDLVRVSPVTNKILMLTLSEGHVDYSDVYGQNGVVYSAAVNTANADNKANYTLISSNDGNYSTARQPLNIGRKAKAKDYNDLYAPVKYVLEHSVYIELPTALIRGRSYTLTLNNLVQNGNTYTFTYDEKNLWSPTIHVNQVGFIPNGVKYAYLSQWMGSFNTGTHANGGLKLDAQSGAQFQVVRTSDNAVVFTGTIAKRKDKSTTETANGDFGASRNFTNADVWECNFSGYTTAGQYYLAVDGIGRSYSFEIAEGAFRNAYYQASKAIFTQRQGVDKEFEGGRVYPRGHHPDDRNVWFTGTTTKVNVWGYYYDAGDWDGHNRHIGVPMDLMLLYDFRPGNFKDGDVGNRYRLSSTSAWINEGTDGLPDILNEAKWLVSFYKRAKDALIAAGRGTGGVIGGRLPNQNGVFGEGYIGPDAGVEGKNSWTDTRPVYVNGEQTANTYLYSGAAAYYAVVLNKFNNGTATTESNSWRTEAINAYNWASARSDGESGTENIQAKILGSACLYRLTGEAKYQNDLKRLLPLDDTYPGWDAWQRMQTWQYAAMVIGMCPANHPNLDVAFQTTLKNHIIARADNDYVNPGNNRGFRFGFNDFRHTTNGAFSVPRMEMVAFAHQMTGDAKYLQQIQHAASYTLGGNENNMTYLSGLGHNPDEKTFHPDAWKLLDFNSRVYTNPNLPGYSNYYGHKTCDFFGCGFEFTGDEDFSRSSASPGIDAWPAGEWRMNNRFSIAGSEFTVEETLSQAAFTYGYLSGSSSVPFTPNARPTVALNFSENQSFPKAGCNLTVSASADTRIVKYYYDWHFIGESTNRANNFAFYWVPPQANGTTVLVTAVGYDDRGLITLPTDAGDRNLLISTSTNCSSANVAVTGVSVSPTTTSLNVGNTQQLTATVAPANATNKTVTWSTSNAAVATVSSSGLVTAIAAGTATVTVTTQDGNKTATSVITVTAAVTCSGTGSILLERYEGLSGTTVAALTGAAKYPNSPDFTSNPTSFEAPANIADNYGLRLRGFLCPPTTGSYTFWIAGDDNVELWLSTNNTPGNKTRIAYHSAWTNSREWNKYSTQKSAAVTLTAGVNYYIEALMKEGTGGDHLAVGWAKPGEATTAPSEVIPGSSLIPAVATPQPSGLTHHWKFNNTGKDEIGTNDATLQNGAAYTTTAKEGTASLNLATSTSANASVGTFNLGTVFSVTMWAYNTGDQVHQNWLLSNSDGSVPGFRFHVNSYNSTDGKIAFETRGSSTVDYSYSAAGVFPFNRWNLVALVVNGSTYTVYVNGTSVHTGTVQAGTNFNRAVYLGSMGDGNTWNTWKGYLDDVKTYNRALSASEIQNLGARMASAEAEDPTGVEVFPNPASHHVQVSFTARRRQMARFTLTNLLGQSIESQQHPVEPGLNRIILPVKAKNGLYLLSVERDGKNVVQKLIIE